MSTKWTTDQLRAIRTIDRSVLVSAAAGSGKTAVLAERCAYLVCDAPTPCSTTELLVVTFTEAAAGEMKHRIGNVLTERLNANPGNDRLRRELALLEHAHISTIHAFCARLVRQYFHLVGVDPQFGILDEDEARVLRMETARTLFQERYETDSTGDFHKLIDHFAEGHDDDMVTQVLRTHALLTSVIDPAGWRNQAIQRMQESADKPLEESVLGKAFLKGLSDDLQGIVETCASSIQGLKKLHHFPGYIRVIESIAQKIRQFQAILARKGFDQLQKAFVNQEKDPRLPAMPEDTPGKETAKAYVHQVRKLLQNDSALAATLSLTSSDYRKGMKSILPQARELLTLVDQFTQRYEQAKRAEGALDFADLERMALLVLADPSSPLDDLQPSLPARACHKRYAHVLIDEYQDVNEVQDAILRLVSRETAAPAPVADLFGFAAEPDQSPQPVPGNLFCVGDVKQSIYRFRLAEPAMFLSRMAAFRKRSGKVAGEVIDLQKNFRSRAPLLDAINAIFARLMTRESAEIEYDRSQQLHPGADYPPMEGPAVFAGAPIELHLLPTAREINQSAAEEPDSDPIGEIDRIRVESEMIARRIQELMGHRDEPRRIVMEKTREGLSPRPICYKDMVILLRAFKYKADEVADVLTQHGIPSHRESATGYFSAVEVRDMLSLLRVLDNPRQDIALASLLRSPLLGLNHPEDLLAKIRLAYPGRNPVVPFHEAAIRYAKEQDDETAVELSQAFERLETWRETARRRPLAELIWRVYQDTDYLAYVSGQIRGEQRSANLIKLHDRARQFGGFSQQGLPRFLAFLDDLESESDLGQPVVQSEVEDVVRIISVHRSKGLEFPVVFLPDMGRKLMSNEGHGRIVVDREAHLGMKAVDESMKARYPSLSTLVVRRRLSEQSMAEELRVLYVAMTRAREHLILIGSVEQKKMDAWKNQYGDGWNGPLSPRTVQKAVSALDWIGPVWALLEHRQSDAIEMIYHSAPEVRQWNLDPSSRPELPPTLLRIARFQPLDVKNPPSPAVQELINRLAYQYPHARLTTLPAAVSVTTASKQAPAEPVLVDESSLDARLVDRYAPEPAFLSSQRDLSALDRGSATHLVLQKLDFHRSCVGDDLAEQIRRLVDRKVLTPEQADQVDADSIEWMMGEEVGQLLRQHAGRLLREQPIYLADPESKAANPLDRTMIRGRIDVLLPLDSGSIVLDYKTDRVSGPALDHRIELYSRQLALYRTAVETITRRTVRSTWLVFLHPRRVVAV